MSENSKDTELAEMLNLKTLRERHPDIMKQEKMAKRTVYKYLNLAYLSPRIVNQLLNGTLTVNPQTLFDIASKSLSFEEQEKEIL